MTERTEQSEGHEDMPGDDSMTERRIGVYVCHCGGNISDYVDVPQVIDGVRNEPGVVVAKRAMFTCSDATQQEIERDIREQHLDGLVVASCSPKLHTQTFREVARRAGLNPYQYTQVNVREQCSWAHTDDREGATDKAKPQVELTDPLIAPIADGQQVGTAKIVADGKTLSEIPVVALQAVPQAGIVGRVWDSMMLMFNKKK